MAHQYKKGSFNPVKRPGAASEAAKREGVSLSVWARKHYNDPGRIGKEARFIKISKNWSHKRAKKTRGGSR